MTNTHRPPRIQSSVGAADRNREYYTTPRIYSLHYIELRRSGIWIKKDNLLQPLRSVGAPCSARVFFLPGYDFKLTSVFLREWAKFKSGTLELTLFSPLKIPPPPIPLKMTVEFLWFRLTFPPRCRWFFLFNHISLVELSFLEWVEIVWVSSSK